MNGLLLINKPKGMTSHDIISQVRRITGVKKVGHTGTLDPNATGLLVVLIGEATKLIPFLEGGLKKYRSEIIFGDETDTDDLTGVSILKKDISQISPERFLEVKSNFIGDIDQVPPAYSAIKRNGKKLYEYARKGENIDIPPRKIYIESIEPVEISSLPNNATIDVVCGKGTYIRALARDIGRELDSAAHMGQLNRLESDGYSLKDAIALEKSTKSEDLQEKLIPLEQIKLALKTVEISDQGKPYMDHGNTLYGHNLSSGLDLFSPGETVQLKYQGKLTGIGIIIEQNGIKKVQPKRILKLSN